MGKSNHALLSFNRGIISKLGLARIDVAKVNLTAEIETNWLPRLLGSMMLRPGLKYLDEIQNGNQAVFIPFIFSQSQANLIEFTDGSIRFWQNDKLLKRPRVNTVITNGNFAGNINGWTDNDQLGTTSSWVSGDYMQLVGTGAAYARRTQAINTAGNQNIEHGVKIIIENGPVKFRIGSTAGDDDYIQEINLGTGIHSLAFTPTGETAYINFFSLLERIVLVKSIEIEAEGVVVISSPYNEVALPTIRFDQSLDVLFLTGGGLQQREIQRSGSGRSWSIILYQSEDGPVRIQNDENISITPSGINGNITLTASNSIFNIGHIGSVWKIVSVGQFVSQVITADNIYTDAIIVNGIGGQRTFTYSFTKDNSLQKLTLEKSFDEGGTWAVVNDRLGYPRFAGEVTFNDGLEDQIVWYRFGVKTGAYLGGINNVSLSYTTGGITGYTRIINYTNETLVDAEVLKDLGSTNATTTWSEAEWSDYRGWPNSVALVEGRLAFSGGGKLIGSLADAYRNFDDEVEGDSGLISRDLGSGPTTDTNWMLSLYKLLIGCDTSIKSATSDYIGAPLTPTNFRIIEPSTQSCANIPAVKLDKTALFVQGSQTRVFQLDYDNSSLDYSATELTKLVPELGKPSITRCAIQRQPETYVHFVRSDGKVIVLLFDLVENLQSWILYETDGEVEEVVVLPGIVEDNVYYAVKRNINGVNKRFLEKFALQDDCQGGVMNKQVDSFIEYNGVATTVINGLDHLEGDEVVVWGDGKDFSPGCGDSQTKFTVSGGRVTLPSPVSQAVIGLPYYAKYKSSKLAYASNSPLGQKKKVNAIGVILNNTHCQGLQYGGSFEIFDNLPLVNPSTGQRVSLDTIYGDIDTPQFSFNGNWDTDSRLYLQAQSPRPCTLLACEIAITTNEKE